MNEADLIDDETKRLIDECMKLSKCYEGKVERHVKDVEEELAQEYRAEEYEAVLRPLKEFLNTAFTSELLLRPLSAHYRNTKKLDAYPLFYSEYPELTQQSVGVEDVMHIAINHLPIPDDSTSWEQIAFSGPT